MNIEEAIEILKQIKKNEWGELENCYAYGSEAIETLLTAYEKEKEANKKLDKEAQGYLEELAGDGSMNIRRIQELESELEKEKEKNKKILSGNIESFQKYFLEEFNKKFISIDKLKEIVDECIPKKENIIARELEYTPNANANSYLTQEILSLLKEE